MIGTDSLRPDLTNIVALVTGAGRGLGRATVIALLDAGARVVLTSRDEATLRETVDASSARDRAHVIVADLARPGECERLAGAAIATTGRVDVLINNAGVGPNVVREDLLNNPIRFWELDRATIEQFFAVNTTAPMLLASLLAPRMIERGWGRIINDTTGLDAMLRLTGYGASKAALEAETACMAKDLDGTGVTANVLIPGGVAATRMGAGLGLAPDELHDPSIMGPPSVWLASRQSDSFSGWRVVASEWDPDLPPSEAADRSSNPIAWTGLQAMGRRRR